MPFDTTDYLLLFLFISRLHHGNLVPRGPFCHALEIRTPGQVQRHSGFAWLCKHNRLRPEPIRFVRRDSVHAQSDGKSMICGLLVLDLTLVPEAFFYSLLANFATRIASYIFFYWHEALRA